MATSDGRVFARGSDHAEGRMSGDAWGYHTQAVGMQTGAERWLDLCGCRMPRPRFRATGSCRVGVKARVVGMKGHAKENR